MSYLSLFFSITQMGKSGEQCLSFLGLPVVEQAFEILEQGVLILIDKAHDWIATQKKRGHILMNYLDIIDQ